MDMLSIAYYALVCSLLGLAGPRLGRAPIRLAIGAVVGIVAASLLPGLRIGLGLY